MMPEAQATPIGRSFDGFEETKVAVLPAIIGKLTLGYVPLDTALLGPPLLVIV